MMFFSIVMLVFGGHPSSISISSVPYWIMFWNGLNNHTHTQRIIWWTCETTVSKNVRACKRHNNDLRNFQQCKREYARVFVSDRKLYFSHGVFVSESYQDSEPSNHNQLMVNGWFGARWFGNRIGVPLSNNPFHKGLPGIQTTNPNQQLTFSWHKSWENNNQQHPQRVMVSTHLNNTGRMLVKQNTHGYPAMPNK